MRKPKNYTLGEAVEGKFKEELIIELARMNNLPVFIETGTANCSTLLAVHNAFKECHSIELSDIYYSKAIEKTKGFKNITLYKGNSEKILPIAIQKINNRALIWLDAHGCGGNSADEGNPLIGELRAITEYCRNCLVLIDDEPNAEITRVTDAGVNLDGWKREYHYGIIFLYKGDFKIPEFI